MSSKWVQVYISGVGVIYALHSATLMALLALSSSVEVLFTIWNLNWSCVTMAGCPEITHFWRWRRPYPSTISTQLWEAHTSQTPTPLTLPIRRNQLTYILGGTLTQQKPFNIGLYITSKWGFFVLHIGCAQFHVVFDFIVSSRWNEHLSIFTYYVCWYHPWLHHKVWMIYEVLYSKGCRRVS